MKTVAIACETTREEYERALALTGLDYETIWMEKKLHNRPELLRSRLQEQLDQIRADRVLLAFGDCGNATIGLETRDFELIKPLVDDCISLFVGSVKKRLELHGSYFLTKGWLDSTENIYLQYKHTLEEYGEELGREIMSMMIGNYKHLALLDTGAEGMIDAAREVERMAGEMGLGWKLASAGLDYLTALFQGPWDDGRFLVVPPNSFIETRPYF